MTTYCQEYYLVRTPNLLSNIVTALMVGCALVVTGLLVRRELAPQSSIPSPPPVENWRDLVRAETTIGPIDAENTIIEFMDYQCPFCITVHPALDSLLSDPGESLKLVVRHFPLPSHGQAIAAAAFADCAAKQVGFDRVHPVLLQNPTLVDSANWDSLGVLAGLPDRSNAASCQADSSSVRPVIESRDEVAGLGVRYTPTFLVNGEWATGVKSREELAELLNPRSRLARILPW